MNWKTAIGIIISALFLFLAFRKVDFAELGTALENANYVYIIPVVLLSLASVSVRSLRWRYLLRRTMSFPRGWGNSCGHT